MKKVLIIEDEYSEVKIAFEYVKDIYFDNELEYTVAVKSQDIPFGKIEDYDYVFVDIRLANRSALDGYAILCKIEKDHPNVKRVIILTGNSRIEEMMKERGVKNKYMILTKPVDTKDLRTIFSK